MSFDAAIRGELTKRLNKTIFPFSFAVSLGFWLIISPGWSLSYTPIATTLLGIAPVVVLRKSRLTANKTIATSPREAFRLFKHPLSALGAYVGSAAALALAFGGTNVFVLSRKHPYYLNPHLIALIIAQLALSAIYLARVILMDRFTLRQQTPKTPSSVPSPLSLLMNLFTSCVLSTLATTATFLIMFTILPTCAKLVPFTRYFIGHAGLSLRFIRGSRFGTVFRIALGTVWTWESIDTVMDIVIAKRTAITHQLPPSQILPNLISGLSSSESVFRYFALCELVDVATQDDKHSSQLREQLYSTLSASSSHSGQLPLGLGASTSSAPNLRFSSSTSSFSVAKQGTHWTPLLRALLLQLGKDYQALVRRGIPAVPTVLSSTMPTASKSSEQGQNIGSELKLRRDGSIFKRGSAQLLSSTSEVAQPTAAEDADRIPDIFRSSTLAPITQTIAAAASAVPVPSVPTSGSLLSMPVARVKSAACDLLPAQVKAPLCLVSGWWSKERTAKKLERMTSSWEIDVCIIQAIAALTSHSLTQDAYGIVQRDVPRIMEALCVMLDEVRTIKVEYDLPANSEGVTVDTQLGDGSRPLNVIEDELKAGISLIVRTFGDSLWKSYRFPERTAKVLKAWTELMQ